MQIPQSDRDVPSGALDRVFTEMSSSCSSERRLRPSGTVAMWLLASISCCKLVSWNIPLGSSLILLNERSGD